MIRVAQATFLVVLVAAGGALSAACARQLGLPAASSAGSPATAKDSSDAGATGAGPAAAPVKPMAGSAAEATQLIGAAVEKKSPEIQKCIIAYRARKNLPRERVTISMGIDQEGRLLGATLPKGKTDTVLSECIQAALANAMFPRSHAGVISITKTYEEIVQ